MSDGAVTVLIPAPLRKLTGGEPRVGADGETLAELIDSLEARYPGIKERVCDPDGELRRFVNVFVNGENARNLDGIGTTVSNGDEVGIIPAMAGGAATR
jgi:molybdopterin synthase sulfur carrier subunit